MKVLVVLARYQYADATRGETHEYSNFLAAIKGTKRDVDFVDTSEYIKNKNIYDLNARLVNMQLIKNYEIIFFVQWGNELFPEALEILKETGATLINWATDDSYRFESFTKRIAKRFSSVITTEFPAVKNYEKIPAQCIKGNWGFSAEWERHPRQASDCVYDVAFVGINYFDRYEYVEFLRENGVNIYLAGYGWPKSNGIVEKEEIPSIYNKSKIVLNFSKSKGGRQTKARVFESLAAGTCLLTECSEDLHHYFTDHIHLITFDTKQECLDTINELLNNPSIRDEIAINGHAHCVAQYSYEKQFKKIFNKIEKRRTVNIINQNKLEKFNDKLANTPLVINIIRWVLFSKWMPSIIWRIVRKIEEDYFKENYLSMDSICIRQPKSKKSID